MVRIKLGDINNTHSTMPGINNRHPINILYCYFLLHIVILLLCKLNISSEQGSIGFTLLFLVVQNLREVNSSGHCNKHVVDDVLETWYPQRKTLKGAFGFKTGGTPAEEVIPFFGESLWPRSN